MCQSFSTFITNINLTLNFLIKIQAQYRQKTILDTLRRPLEDETLEESQNDMNDPFKEKDLFYISKIEEFNLKKFHHCVIDEYLDEDIIRIFTDVKYKSSRLRAFLRDNFQPNESRGKYLLGLETTDLDWLLFKFSQISQNTKYLDMHKCVNKLLVKLF